MNKRLWIYLAAFSFCWMVQPATAFLPVMSPMNDAVIPLKATETSVMAMLQEQIKQNKEKTQEAKGGPGKTACTVKLKIIETKTYAFAKKAMLGESKSELTPPKKTYGEAKDFVTTEWFAQEESITTDKGNVKGLTVDQIEKTKKKRQAFLQTTGARTLAHATQLREKVNEDAATIMDANQYPEQGCNEVGDMGVQNVRLLAIIQQQLVNTALQLEALELAIVRDIIKETADDKASEEDSPLKKAVGAVTGVLK